MKWHVIVNPSAGGGRGGMKWPIIRAELIKEGFEFDFQISEKKDQIITLSKEAVEQGSKKLIVVGGDGSLFEMVNGIYLQNKVSPSDIVIGQIPVGTGNDWGKMYENSLDFRKSIQIIKEGRTFRQDLGTIYFPEEKKRYYFVNIAGLGFDGAVLKEVWKQKEKGRNGAMIYLLMLVKSLFGSGYHKVTLTYSGTKEEQIIFSMAAGIGRYNGNGMMQLPFSHPADGMLDVSIINKIGKIEVIREVKNLFSGTYVKNKHVRIRRTDKIIIESGKKIPVEADGEFLGYSPVEIGILPAGASFFINKTDFSIDPKIKDYAPDIVQI
ncbi:MAG TPA: diacylglycerol kinase family lipid kinase [Bacteroidia bacterium]|nr:diacylglycerol kinase family lipid kinase [Bacteroidia bacterium]HRS57630.1 diacylglycerol kinase family lipid kinase [Bacteroidia bacterium]HRU68917.1 diacylglycerol kinase family lipid kinase [Bacteroidia bacterium]